MANATKSDVATKTATNVPTTQGQEPQTNVLQDRPNYRANKPIYGNGEVLSAKDKIAANAANYPEHVRNIAYLMKNNSEIRRFTAIGIINYLLQKGEIKGEKRYVSFLWNKFQVKVDGLTKEYYYTEPFFLNCLVASFASFSASAQRTINIFTRKEMSCGIDKAVDPKEVQDIMNLTTDEDSPCEETKE